MTLTKTLLFIEHVLAPGYKGRAKFMFFAENCQVRRSHLADFEKQLSPILVGKWQVALLSFVFTGSIHTLCLKKTRHPILWR